MKMAFSVISRGCPYNVVSDDYISDDHISDDYISDDYISDD